VGPLRQFGVGPNHAEDFFLVKQISDFSQNAAAAQRRFTPEINKIHSDKANLGAARRQGNWQSCQSAGDHLKPSQGQSGTNACIGSDKRAKVEDC
jgi:hypothetical protein